MSDSTKMKVYECNVPTYLYNSKGEWVGCICLEYDPEYKEILHEVTIESTIRSATIAKARFGDNSYITKEILNNPIMKDFILMVDKYGNILKELK